MEHFLLQLFIFLVSAAIAVPIAKKCGLGSVLGYLIAGIVVGPAGFSLINDVDEVMHFTEFGVVMMLFLVGLELRPSLLWKMRVSILGMGGGQVILTSLAIFSLAVFFINWQYAVAISLILALSSTAIVLQTLQEKGLMETQAGKSIFSVLLFQDLAVIPMLAIFPMLATLAVENSEQSKQQLVDFSLLPPYAEFIATLLAILLVLVIGKFACRPFFRAIASTGIREIFVAAALALVIGISVLMIVVGLSPALGAFVAGVVLADSEYRHELESDIEPFKGLLLGIFFISIGASLNFEYITDSAVLIAAITIALMIIKWSVLLLVGKLFHLKSSERRLFAISLAQGGEFAFVLFQVSKTQGVLPVSLIDPVMSSVVISMFIAPLLFLIWDKVGLEKGTPVEQTLDDVINSKDHKVILAGFGRMGTDVGRFLLSAGIKPVILDHDANNVEVLRKFGFEVYFGDATRLDLLESAGAAEAELLVIAISQENTSKLVDLCHKHYPKLKVVVAVRDREAAFEMMDKGVKNIHRETFGSALQIGQDVLNQLGCDPHSTYRLMKIFQQKDKDMMPELHLNRNEEKNYLALYQQHHFDLEDLIKRTVDPNAQVSDQAWTAKNPEH
ncbi:monovalent cation:proton antiporter-2 (CPA2) family protein [Shewanella marisflavi]|uniref:Potassium transporter n=1 Tax=Shewanella marisflavi TaxID=260364 RepID=A0AAC9XMI2_9GAMM|nr:monovalent cation:proton antiporter-2 (CPA2) family protein [Shewanella marisflavi]ASJ95931.1 potassium transporter [Shewanella marisflavi]